MDEDPVDSPIDRIRKEQDNLEKDLKSRRRWRGLSEEVDGLLGSEDPQSPR